MSARVARGIVGAVLSVLAGAVAIGLGGCGSGARCVHLREALNRCGFPVGELNCARVDFTTLEELSARMETRSCGGLSDGDAVDPRLCAVANWACPDSPTLELPARPTANPVIFVGGIDDTPIFDWNPNIVKAVREAGSDAHHVKVLSWAPTKERAFDLWQSLSSLRTQLGARKLNLVCYAVAGLDCRYLVSPNGLFKADATARAEVVGAIASVTTIATPHRGTRVAEAAIVALESSTVTDVLHTLLGVELPSTLPDDARLTSTLRGLTLEALWMFNQTIRDEPQIYYQSWAGVSSFSGKRSDAAEKLAATYCVDADGQLAYGRHADTVDALNPALWPPMPFSGTARGDDGAVVASPSDGMISVVSAKWGRFRGCLPADHYDVIGELGHTTRDPLTGFDARRFYAFVAADLAERGY